MRSLLPALALLFACSSPETPEGRASATAAGSGGASAGSAGTSPAGAGGSTAGSAGAPSAAAGQAGQSAGAAGAAGVAAGASGGSGGGGTAGPAGGGQAGAPAGAGGAGAGGAGGATAGAAGAPCNAKLAMVEPQSKSCISQSLNAIGQDTGWCESTCGGYTKVATCTTGHFPPVQCAELLGFPNTFCCKVAICYEHQHACPSGGSPLNCGNGNYPADKKCTVPDPAKPQEACCSQI